MQHDLFTMVLEFFKRGHLPKGINTSYIALIPKVVGSSYFNDYRPISLCNLAYKIITKIIANHLKPMMSKWMSEEQFGFFHNAKKEGQSSKQH